MDRLPGSARQQQRQRGKQLDPCRMGNLGKVRPASGIITYQQHGRQLCQGGRRGRYGRGRQGGVVATSVLASRLRFVSLASTSSEELFADGNVQNSLFTSLVNQHIASCHIILASLLDSGTGTVRAETRLSLYHSPQVRDTGSCSASRILLMLIMQTTRFWSTYRRFHREWKAVRVNVPLYSSRLSCRLASAPAAGLGITFSEGSDVADDGLQACVRSVFLQFGAIRSTLNTFASVTYAASTL